MKDGQIDHGRAQAQKSTRDSLEFIKANIGRLLRVRSGKKHYEAARRFIGKLERGEQFTEGEISYIDGLYEKIWLTTNVGKSAGKIGVHSDPKRKGLRF